jgi:lysophospholipase L1-like esterase
MIAGSLAYALIALGVVALAAFIAHRVTCLRMRRKAEPAAAAKLIVQWRQNETVAGAFALALAAERDPAALIGVENCYYNRPDFKRVTWVPKDMPVPFVGCAPVPGPLASGFVNSMHFRYAREIEIPKPANVIRIFFTGASTAFGLGAPSNDATIGGYLEKYLNGGVLERDVRCEVVTAAAGAWTSTHERILIENRLIELEPDVVISLSGHNDAFWAVDGRNIFWFRVFQEDYFFSLVNVALALNEAEEFPSYNPGAGPPIGPEQAARRLLRNVTFSHHALATVGADYVFALQPVMDVSRKVRTPREQRVAAIVSRRAKFVQMPAFYREFRNSLAALERPGFHFVDASTVFDAYDDQIEVFVDTSHFGDRGNDLIAQYLCGRLVPIIKARLMASRGMQHRNKTPAKNLSGAVGA